jgi:hypothetical protein
MAAGVCVGACDQGVQHDVPIVAGPPLHVVGFNGTAAGGKLPIDGYAQIAFDRLLDPASVTRQSFSIRDDEGNFLEPQVTYDPVRRVVSVSGSGNWLTVGATYAIILGVATASDTTGTTGPKAIDGAPLTAQVVETFQAVADPGPTPPLIFRANVDVCKDVLPIFQNDCSNTNCHGTPPGDGTYPREGLALDSPIGLTNTAIGRMAQEANTGATAGIGAAPGRQFGVQMPIIDSAGDPGNSWLLYKLLMAPQGPATAPNPQTCGDAGAPPPVSGATTANPDAPSVAMSESDRAILTELVLGNQMPYPPNAPLSTEELERITAWIAHGAQVVQCPSCPGP